jgi:hypothetical protein
MALCHVALCGDVPLEMLCAVCGWYLPQHGVVSCCFVKCGALGVLCAAGAGRKHDVVSLLLLCSVVPLGCFVRCVAGARRKHGVVSCCLV